LHPKNEKKSDFKQNSNLSKEYFANKEEVPKREMDELDFMDIDIDNLSSSEVVDDVQEEDDDDFMVEELMAMMDKEEPAVKVKRKKVKRKRPSDKGKEEEDEDLEYLFEEEVDIQMLLNGPVDQEEEDEMELDSSEERQKKKKELALKKLDSKKNKRKKRAPSPKKRQKTTSNDFPNKKDMVGLMAYIHSSGYTSICKGSERAELSEAQKKQVDDKAFALANFFSKRLDMVIVNTTKAIRTLVERGSSTAFATQTDQLGNLFDAIKKYRRLVIPGGADDKPDAICPFTLSKINHETSVRMVLVPDEEDSVPVMFYTDERVAHLIRTLHTLYHFGAYFNLDLDRVINSAKKTLEEGTEDPEIVWDAVFNPMESVPKHKRDQQPGTRLVGLKQDLLINLCKGARAYVGDEPFKV
jgi:hypothetical protein